MSEWFKEHALESVSRRKSTEGSNPSLSAIAPPALPQPEVKGRQLATSSGEVPEWSIGAVSKTVERESVPWVRIPPSPPSIAGRVEQDLARVCLESSSLAPDGEIEVEQKARGRSSQPRQAITAEARRPEPAEP